MGSIYEEVRIAFHAIWNRRWVALAAAWAICLVGWLVVSQIPNKYESVAKVRVDISSVLPTKVGISDIDQQRGIDRVRQSLASAVNLEKVVRGTDLANTVANDRDIAERVAQLQKQIKVTATTENLVEITAEASSPKLARAIAQKLIDIFVETNLAGNREENAQTLEFLDKQLADRQAQLSSAEAKRAQFQSQFLGSLPGTGSIDDRIAAARSSIAQVDQDLAQANSMLAVANGQLAGTPASLPGAGPVAGPARARLNLIAGQIAEGRGRGYTDAHPDMVALRSQYAAAQAAAAREPMSGGGGVSNPSYMAARSMQTERAGAVAALQTKKALIQGDLDRLQAKLTEQPDAAAEQGKIERDYQVLKDGYDKLLADRQDIQLRGQVQTQTSSVKFSVTDPPTLSSAPATPNRPLLLTGVLLAGIAGGVGAAFALGQLRTTYPTAGRLERASGLPVIGAIGEVLTAAQTALRRKQLKYFAGGAGALAVAFVALIGVEFLQRGLLA
ncbi:MAG: XrtA system polysaccharide chain length determinant [Pseudomonadota bacterium]